MDRGDTFVQRQEGGFSGRLISASNSFLSHPFAISELSEYLGWRSHSQHTQKLLLEVSVKCSLSIKALKYSVIIFSRYAPFVTYLQKFLFLYWK